MMLLISMAIVVAYGASMATSLDWLDLDFWWELAALVTIMLLGHWQEMKAIGQAQGRPGRPGRAAARRGRARRRRRRARDRARSATWRPGDVVLVRSGGRVPADGDDRRRARPRWTSR